MGRTMPSRRVAQGQHLVLNFMAASLLLFCRAVAGNGKFDTIFVIGDSTLDNGNRDPNNATTTAIGRVNQPWTPPFGRTTPGVPTGRFSNGKVLSDILAEYIGLSPLPYRVVQSSPSSSTNVSQGINFAVGGAGVRDNLGFTKTPDQIQQLQAVLSRGLYPSTVFGKAVVLYAVSGNDYAALLRNTSNNIFDIFASVPLIVEQIAADLRALYAQGFRNFVVPKISPIGCVPSQTYPLGYQLCFEPANALAVTHNVQLQLKLWLTLPRDANVIFLDSYRAFSDVVYNFTNSDRLKPCCTGQQNGVLCGDLSPAGTPLYTLCDVSSQGKYFFWDEFHPTEAGWRIIFDLYKEARYTGGLVSLDTFLGL